jgi:TRAP-type C4-dicarboxylate transport system permease small subunit
MNTAADTPVPDEKLVGDDGAFHAHDAAVRLDGTPLEGWAALALFWALGLTVFYQFFTRYALNDSAAWTEEIARYLLIGVVFVGAAVGVKRNNHIQVDLLYRYLPRGAGRALATVVDVLRIAFFAATVLLTAQMMQRMGNYKMTIIDAPMNIVYGVCLAGFAAMLVRAVLIAVRHWRQGWSLLERPGAEDDAQ